MSTALSEQRRARKQAQLRQGAQLLRAGLFGFTVSIAILVAGYLLMPILTPQASGMTQTGQGKIINIQAAMDGFDMRQIHVRAGEKITINLLSLDNEHHADGGGKHQFAINELGINIVAAPLSSASATFTAAAPGTFTYYCDICCGGKANPTMNGKLVVEPAS